MRNKYLNENVRKFIDKYHQDHPEYNPENELILLTTSKNKKHILNIKLFSNFYPSKIELEV